MTSYYSTTQHYYYDTSNLRRYLYALNHMAESQAKQKMEHEAHWVKEKEDYRLVSRSHDTP